MSKAYSNKALPAGTVLREWRLEEVLGVGGFGIVYKGRGIYFNELVAIKEYFPSSISERDAEDTVVPIDSDAEEVHALGLKKFVEEAKLLWNLSTPSRHPNIVSVRSLFEIHGTAYMVMDFEDGLSLSKMLKNGARFNERSLYDLIRPIAEGLDRAHRVGVLHRDIKPPNILITEGNRSVLIDFGSARFEAAEATSTTVTFHTPPYAAIEQYVKTYDQGPWTDIYALGVVLYECVTGEKPPEVLERLHGGLGKALSDGKWPGYSQRFLAAIDSAMTIKPADRPQSIPDWLALFDGNSKRVRSTAVEIDEDATRVVPFNTAADAIVPVAPPVAGFEPTEPIETQVPADPSEAQFKRAGQETNASKKARSSKAGEPEARKSAALPAAASAAATAAAAAPAAILDRGRRVEPPEPAKDPAKKTLSPVVIGGGALALVVAAVAGWTLLGSGGKDESPAASEAQAPALAINDVADLAPAAKSLADDAGNAGAPESAVSRLIAASEEQARIQQELQPLMADPIQGPAAKVRADRLKQLATAAYVEFANALVGDANARAERLSAAAPWANPARDNAARGQPADRQRTAANLRNALTSLRAGSATAAAASDPAQALAAARSALGQWQSFAAAASAVSGLQATAAVKPIADAALKPVTEVTRKAAPVVERTVAEAPSTSSATTLTPAKISQLNGIIDDARRMAKQVIAMGDRNRPGSGATAAEREGYELRKANVPLARSYDANLATLKDSVRGVKTDRDADRLIKQANQTRAYLQFLVKRSSGSLGR